MLFSKRKLGGAAIALAAPILLSAAPAFATFSVVGVDQQTAQVGGALSTCLYGTFGTKAIDLQREVYASAPGVGVVHGQAFYFGNRRAQIAERLKRYSIGTTISALKQAQRYPTSDLYERTGAFGFEGSDALNRRQYLVAKLGDTPQGFTGSNTTDLGAPDARAVATAYSPDRAKRFRLEVGGNTLTSTTVIDQMRRSAAVDDTRPYVVPVLEKILGIKISDADAAKLKNGDLAERLFLTEVVPAIWGGGDKRCTPNGRPSDLAYLRVDAFNGTTLVNLTWEGTSQSPLTSLAYKYFVCRTQSTKGTFDSPSCRS